MRATLHLAWLLPGLVFLGPPAVRADDPPKPNARTAVARNTGEAATFLRREAPGKPWAPVAAKEELFTGDLLMGGLDAGLTTLSGDMSVAVKGDLADQSPFPVFETALILHPAKDVDLDFTLDRGRVAVTNTKKSGPAKVRVHVRDKAGEVTLKEPGASFALETYGRWPTGVPFKKDADASYGPPLALVFLVLKGEVAVKGPRREGTLKAPPGLSLFITDSIDDPNPEPQFLQELPAWASGGAPSEREKKAREALARFRAQVLTKPVGEVLDQFVRSEDPVERRGAVLLMGATDDLERLGEALMNAKHTDVWDAAVLALRHWIGRDPGQDMKLYNGLIEKRGFKPVQAEAILSLLHGFSREDLSLPETYETLINYMESDKLGLRGLAHWHLSRLVPQGQKFDFDPLAPKEKREAAIKKWRELIPVGKLPPKPKADDK